MIEPIDLLTARLSLRRLTPADAPFILELLNDPEWLRFIGDKGVRDLDGARRYIETGPQDMYSAHGLGLLRVGLREGDTPIGLCGLLKRNWLPDVDLGFAFLPAHRGQGLAFEAARATLDDGRARLSLSRVAAITVPANQASIRLLERLGFAFERIVRMPGESEDLKLYGYSTRAA